VTLAIKIPHGPAGRDQLVDAEGSLGVELPAPYRSFLATVGGGHTGDLEVPGTDGMGVLQELYSATDLVARNASDAREAGFAVSVPREYLLIGEGAGGALCLQVTGEDRGSVWWADFDLAGEYEDEDPHQDVMIRLAGTFDEFLELF